MAELTEEQKKRYLDGAGVKILWDKIKGLISEGDKGNTDALDELKRIVNEHLDKVGKPEGIATLDANGQLTDEQLKLKTINGETLKGEGDIKIDLSLYKVVDELPTGNDIDENKIYLVVKSATPNEEPVENTYIEYIYFPETKKWEKLGEYFAAVDLTPYLKIEDLDTKATELGYVKNTALEPYAKTVDVNETLKDYALKSELYDDTALVERVETLEAIDHTQFLTEHQDISGLATKEEVTNDLATKVDKIDGKGLSTNDFTDELKTKLDGVEAGAKVNVQSDWDEIDETSDAFIKNKPVALSETDLASILV